MNADKIACDLLTYPNDEKYAENIRQFQGCPSIAVTEQGRIFLAWYSGGVKEPHMDNYNLLIYSNDNGKSWSKPILVIPSSRENLVHALDIQLWMSPQGKLWIFWVQNNTEIESDIKPVYKEGQPMVCVDGYIFNDFEHAEWVCVCEEPDAEILIFSEPRYLDKGFLRCKPLVLKDGRWIQFNYDQIEGMEGRYGYSISKDNGKSWQHYYGARKLKTNFDETMAYEKEDGSIRMLARTGMGKLAQSVSLDGGYTWQPAELTDIDHPSTRFFIARTPSGRVLLVNNDHDKERRNMTVYLSEDDGETWKYKRCIDDRNGLSYPDVDFFDGKIYLTYDRGRTSKREILFAIFTEEDVINCNNEINLTVVSKPEKHNVGHLA